MQSTHTYTHTFTHPLLQVLTNYAKCGFPQSGHFKFNVATLLYIERAFGKEVRSIGTPRRGADGVLGEGLARRKAVHSPPHSSPSLCPHSGSLQHCGEGGPALGCAGSEMGRDGECQAGGGPAPAAPESQGRFWRAQLSHQAPTGHGARTQALSAPSAIVRV